LEEFKKNFESGAPPYDVTPERVATMHRATAELKASGIEGRAQRKIEECGIPTVSITVAKDVTAAIKAPRAVFVLWPMGHHFGAPFCTHVLRQVILTALEVSRRLSKAGRSSISRSLGCKCGGTQDLSPSKGENYKGFISPRPEVFVALRVGVFPESASAASTVTFWKDQNLNHKGDIG
jgi:hypothetical protein